MAFGIGLWLSDAVFKNDLCTYNFSASSCVPLIGLKWGSFGAQWLLIIPVWLFDLAIVYSYME